MRRVWTVLRRLLKRHTSPPGTSDTHSRVFGQTLGQQRPWTLIESDDPTLTLGEGRFSDYVTLNDAARAFALSEASHKQLVYDDDEVARWLTSAEELRLALVCAIHGVEVVDVP